ncbi:MAG: leucine-rich repeat protein, partial [Saprospiraceae bacterium]|nr:leucine-rich repeat protein [Saprospiraceae bacterium]
MKSSLTHWLLFFVAIFTTLISNAQNCLPDGIGFYSQSDINNFAANYPGCTHIEGNVYISSNNITNLNGLSQLQSIGGNLDISWAPNLTSLQGLSNVTSINGFSMYNTKVTTLTPLQNLQNLKYLYIDNPVYTPAFNSLNGLQGLTSLEYITLSNIGITSLNGLQNLTSLKVINLNYLSALNTLNGISNISHLDRVSVSNSVLTNLSSLQTIATIDTLYLYLNNQLTNFSGLAPCVVKNIYSGNPSLNSLQGLQHLTQLKSLIINESKLTDLSELGQLTQLDSLVLESNNMLLNLNGLQNLTTLPFLSLRENNVLASFTGLGNVVSMGRLSMSQCPKIIDFTTLSSLSKLDDLHCSSNPMLHLAGLESIDSLRSVSLNELPSVVNLNGLNNLKHVERLFIGNCDELTSLQELQNLENTGELFLGNCSKITNLAGLEQVKSATDLLISNCSTLGNISALKGIKELSGDLYIDANSTLTSLDGLNNIDSIGGEMSISFSPALTSIEHLSSLKYVGRGVLLFFNAFSNLHGLENLEVVNGNVSPLLGDTLPGSLYISENPQLTDINALQSLQSFNRLYIVDNPQLSLCSVAPICAAVYNFPQKVVVSDNAPGCNSKEEILDHCSGRSVTVEVLRDDNATCASGLPVPDLPVRLVGTVQTTLRPTDQAGKASFKFLEQGDFNLELPQINSGFWNICELRYVLTGSNGQDSTHVKLFLSPKGLCPNLIAKLNLPPNFRGCLVSTPVGFSVRNEGTYQSENAVATVVLPSVFNIVSTDVPISNQQGDTLYFNLGNIQPLETKNINITVITQCGADVAGHTLCVEGFVKLDNPCPEVALSYSKVVAKAECINDEIVRFTLKNIGDAPTLGWHEYKVIRNTSVVANYSFSLNNQQSLVLEYPADGATWRIEATHLDDGTQTAAAIEGCNGLTPGLITAFWLDHGPDKYDFDCRQVVQAYDPNEKTAIPGFPNNEITIISGREPIFYTIHFQNTGTDTAFRVQLLDQLDEVLDISTFQAEGSSHPCTWELRGNTLVVLFQPIALPDSNISEPNSRGFFRFSIRPKAELPPFYYIRNSASIIFDYNPAITTNTVYHLKGQ